MVWPLLEVDRRQPRRAVVRARWPRTWATSTPATRPSCAGAGATRWRAGSPACSPPTPRQRPQLLVDWRRTATAPATSTTTCLAARAVAGAGRRGSAPTRRTSGTPNTVARLREAPEPTCRRGSRCSGTPGCRRTEIELLDGAGRPTTTCTCGCRTPATTLWRALGRRARRDRRAATTPATARCATRCWPRSAATSASCSAACPPIRRPTSTSGRRRPRPTRCSAGCSPTSPPTPFGREGRTLAADDRSVQVHSCHGPARQVDVLREVLLGLLADDPTLEPRDILVMCPDIETYAPLIIAGFGLGDVVHGRPSRPPAAGPARRPLAGPDQPAARRGRAAARPGRRPGHRQRGAQPRAGRAGARAGSGSPTTTSRPSPAGSGRRTSAGASTRSTARPYGVDFVQNTWRFGLDRVLAGVAMSDDSHAWIDTHAAAGRRRQQPRRPGRPARRVRRPAAARHRLARPAPSR